MPIVRRLTFGIRNRWLEKVVMYGLLAPLEKRLNRYLTDRYARQYLVPVPQCAAIPIVQETHENSAAA
jgi:hypothetical protein